MVGISVDYTEMESAMDYHLHRHTNKVVDDHFVTYILVVLLSTAYINITSMKTVTYGTIDQSKLFYLHLASLINLHKKPTDMDSRVDRFWLLGKHDCWISVA